MKLCQKSFNKRGDNKQDKEANMFGHVTKMNDRRIPIRARSTPCHVDDSEVKEDNSRDEFETSKSSQRT